MSNCKTALLAAAFGLFVTDSSFAQQAGGQSAADGPPPVQVDEKGTVHISELKVPMSSYVSEAAKKSFMSPATGMPTRSGRT